MRTKPRFADGLRGAPCALVPYLFFAFSCPAASAQNLESPVTYHNARYGYAISYPADLFKAEPEAVNGDGRKFHALKGGANFAVWAGYNSLQQTPAGIADEASADCLSKSAPYRVAKASLVAVSCETKDGIFYRKTLIRGDVLTSLEMTYPPGERATWDPVVTQISASLTAAK